LDEAIRLDASNSTAYMLRGSIFKSLHKESAALQDFSEALRLDPENAYVLKMRMWMWFAKSNSEKAEAHATALLKLIPDCAEAFHARGDARAMQGKFDQARADFLKALAHDPKNTWIREKLVACCVKLKNYDEALVEMDRVVELEPQKADSLLDRAGLHMLREEYDEAVKDASKAAEIEPKSSKAYMLRAVAYQELESSDLEKADLDRVIELANEFLEEALWERAWLRATSPKAERRDAKGAFGDALAAACRSCWPKTKSAGLQMGQLPERKLQIVSAVLAENQQFLLASLVQEIAIQSTTSGISRLKAQERLDDYRAGKLWRETKIH
jgi:tetratricopeptide (TPR) repeat protein